jgi:hypothetical protein
MENIYLRTLAILAIANAQNAFHQQPHVKSAKTVIISQETRAQNVLIFV